MDLLSNRPRRSRGAIIALVFSAKSAGSAQASANASEVSALVAKQQHAHELARDGIIEFGPWRAEATIQGDRYWRFINTSDQAMHDLDVDAFDTPWDVVYGEEVKPGWNAIVSYPVDHEYAFPQQVEVSWRASSTAAPKTTILVRMHHPRAGIGDRPI